MRFLAGVQAGVDQRNVLILGSSIVDAFIVSRCAVRTLSRADVLCERGIVWTLYTVWTLNRMDLHI